MIKGPLTKADYDNMVIYADHIAVWWEWHSIYGRYLVGQITLGM